MFLGCKIEDSNIYLFSELPVYCIFHQRGRAVNYACELLSYVAHIYDEMFCENRKRLKAVNYFRNKAP